jgi:signal transduction histidine kinase
MPSLTPPSSVNPALVARAGELFEQRRVMLQCSTDRNFAILMVLQWVAALLFVAFVSPRTWAGANSAIHPHVWLVLFFGGAATALPVALALLQPGRALTRHVVAVGQMMMSALLIHISGGRIETHFHVFGSLAFLAFYRDWRVLVTASLVVAVDHFVRGLYLPQSIFGMQAVSPWRWLEHAGWVVFEDVFLMISIRQSLAEMLGVAERQARLEMVNGEIEQQVAERTAELVHENTERKRSEEALRESELRVRETHKELLKASRSAGMAEIASNVLHNVGNVLNSVNVSIALATEKVRGIKVETLERLATMLHEQPDLAQFVASDPRGKDVPDFLIRMAKRLGSDRAAVLEDLAALRQHIEHVNEIVSVQQSYTNACGVTEVLPLADLLEDALRLNAGSIERHGLDIIRDYSELPPVPVDRHKVLQILVNLIRNAKHALDDGAPAEKRLTLRLVMNGGSRARVSVSDNGVGIPAENLARIFEHGFTTRKEGHGFGLHSSANAAHEMGGTLTAQSDGSGSGATFTLELPLQSEPPTS